MTNKNKIYKCMYCGNLIEKLEDNSNDLVCCGKSMVEQLEKSQDTKLEKHVPYIEKISENEILVKIGEVDKHPMTEEHYIEFIEVLTKNGYVLRKYLSPGDEPEAKFNVSYEDVENVREFCNLHGLWSNKLN
jgi:superoxide reductase